MCGIIRPSLSYWAEFAWKQPSSQRRPEGTSKSRRNSAVFPARLSIAAQRCCERAIAPRGRCYAFLSEVVLAMNFNLAQGFYESSLRHGDSVALSVGAQEVTYLQLREEVQPIARWLRENSNEAA